METCPLVESVWPVVATHRPVVFDLRRNSSVSAPPGASVSMRAGDARSSVPVTLPIVTEIRFCVAAERFATVT